MRDFLLKLIAGAPKSSLDKQESRFALELCKAKVLSDREFLRFDENIIIGVYQQPKPPRKGKKTTGFLQPIARNSRDFIVLPGDSLNASHHDLVIARSIGNKRGRAAAKIVYIAEDSGEKTICYVSRENRRAELRYIETAMPAEIGIKQKELKDLEDGAVLAIDRKSGEIAGILGVLSDPKVDEAIVLSRYNREDRFSADEIAEAKSHGAKVDRSLIGDRRDLTPLEFITIDPIDAKDYDDAIFYDDKNRILYVAIADVSSYVFDLGHIDKEAKKRGFSIYLPHKSIPMLPRELSENLCSLAPNEDRLAFTFKIELDENLSVKKYELFESAIRSAKRYHYDRVDELLGGSPPEKDDISILKWLLPLKDLITALREKRLKKGFSFSNPEIKLILDENLRLIETRKAKETISHQLIEECMLLANCAAAEYFQLGIFRVHESPDPRSVEELLANLREIGIAAKPQKDIRATIAAIQSEGARLGLREQVDRMLIRSLKRAQYAFDNVGHFGLGFVKYAHFTSPIRRYSDLALHRLLKAILKGDEKHKGYLISLLRRIAPIISMLETETAQIERQYADRVFARWAKERIGMVLEGEIIEEAPKDGEAAIIIDDPIIQGMKCYAPISRGDINLKFARVKVEIVSAHLATARITARVLKKA